MVIVSSTPSLWYSFILRHGSYGLPMFLVTSTKLLWNLKYFFLALAGATVVYTLSTLAKMLVVFILPVWKTLKKWTECLVLNDCAKQTVSYFNGMNIVVNQKDAWGYLQLMVVLHFICYHFILRVTKIIMPTLPSSQLKEYVCAVLLKEIKYACKDYSEEWLWFIEPVMTLYLSTDNKAPCTWKPFLWMCCCVFCLH